MKNYASQFQKFRSTFFGLGVLIAIWCISTSFMVTPSWEFKKEKNGIKVFVRQMVNTPIKELKIEYTLEASLKTIAACLNDPNQYQNWIYKTSESRLIKKVDDKSFVYYCLTDFPWPTNDRDLVVLTRMSQNTTTGQLRSISQPLDGVLAEKEDIIRVRKFSTNWEVTPIKKNLCKVVYHLITDPGGNIPDWVINMGIDQGPIATMEAFRKEVQKPMYQSNGASKIKEWYP